MALGPLYLSSNFETGFFSKTLYKKKKILYTWAKKIGQHSGSLWRVILPYYSNCNWNGKQILCLRSELNTSKYRFLVTGFYCISYCANWVGAKAWAKNMEKVEGFLFPPHSGPDTSDWEEAQMGIASFLFPLLSFFFLPFRRVCLVNWNIVQICRIFVFYHFKLVLFLLHHFLFFGALHWGVCGIFIMTSSTVGAHVIMVMCSPSRFHFTNILG